MMFDVATDILEGGRVAKSIVMCNGSPLTYADVLGLWRNDSEFRTYFASLLADSPFTAYRWETPSVANSTHSRPFEFVLIDSPGFNSRKTDSDTYKDYFTTNDTDQGVVVFENLRKDATLIVPSPRGPDTDYGHLAAFVRHAPDLQVDALWQVIGKTVAAKMTDSPLWISTAGGGVAWLHVRLDSRPKYYGFTPYKNTA